MLLSEILKELDIGTIALTSPTLERIKKDYPILLSLQRAEYKAELERLKKSNYSPCYKEAEISQLECKLESECLDSDFFINALMELEYPISDTGSPFLFLHIAERFYNENQSEMKAYLDFLKECEVNITEALKMDIAEILESPQQAKANIIELYLLDLHSKLMDYEINEQDDIIKR